MKHLKVQTVSVSDDSAEDIETKFSSLEGSSIEGTLLMLDDRTPHVAVPVQAIRNGKVIATTLSDESGKYRFTDLKTGQYQVRCRWISG